MSFRTSLLCTALSLCAAWTGAQTVYRCGSSYASQPCAGGTAIDVTDSRTAADASRASKVAADDMKRAEAMEKARLAQERNAPKALVIGPQEPPPKPPAPPQAKGPKDKKKAKAPDPNVFTATAPKKAR